MLFTFISNTHSMFSLINLWLTQTVNYTDFKLYLINLIIPNNYNS